MSRVDHPAEGSRIENRSTPAPADVESRVPRYRAFRRAALTRNLVTWTILIGLFAYSMWGTSFGIGSLFSGLTESFQFIFVDTMPPRFEETPEFIGPLLETVYMSFVGVVISVAVSIPLGILGARNVTPSDTVVYLSRTVTGFVRAVPGLIMAIFLVAVFGIGPLAGTLALGIGGIGILAKAYADAIEEIDMGQIEGLRSTGARWLQILVQGVWPQFKPAFLTWSLYRLERNVHHGTVLGLVGAGGIGFALLRAINLYQFRTATTILLIIFVLVLGIEAVTTRLRRRAI